MKNALIWGFCHSDMEKAVRQLEQQSLLNARAWFGDERHDFDVVELSMPSWIDTYREKYADYMKTYKHNHDCYDYVYKELGFFISIQSRYDEYRPAYCEQIEFVHTFNLYYRLAYSVIMSKHIDLCLFINVPHEGMAVIIYLIAKYLKIPTIILYQMMFDRFACLSDINEFGKFPQMDAGNQGYFPVPKTAHTDLGYMKDIPPEKKYTSFLRILLRGSLNPARIIQKAGRRYPRFCRQRDYQNNLTLFSSIPDLTRKFVYFPLHLQPELTTHSLGGRYCDQLLALERIAELIPDDWVVYAKENPKQGYYMRPNSFFERLKRIKNVRLVSKDVSTFSLIESSQFVGTISGTAGWEAIKSGKCALIFGMAWYQSFPGVFRYTEGLDVRDILEYKIVHNELEVTANKFINRMWDGFVDPVYIEYAQKYSSEENTASVLKCLKQVIRQLDGQI